MATKDRDVNFVGRKAEQEAFERLLENPYGKQRIALILGGGGKGKTYLVQKMLKIKKEKISDYQ